jgi:hypothetical protein
MDACDPVNLSDPTGWSCKKKKKERIEQIEHAVTGDKISLGPVDWNRKTGQPSFRIIRRQDRILGPNFIRENPETVKHATLVKRFARVGGRLAHDRRKTPQNPDAIRQPAKAIRRDSANSSGNSSAR